MSAGAYSFLPSLRTGLATRITAPDGNLPRATVQVKLILAGDPLTAGQALTSPVEQAVQIYGPGDVVGVDPRAISRTEPRPFANNVEPNYLAHIEFYDEDFPSRYSPVLEDGNKRLLPWLALIVLSGGSEGGGQAEFEEQSLPDRPLPFITVTNPAALQPQAELGAWAHVHVNGELDGPLALDVDPDLQPVALANLRGVLRERPDSACSRLLCPRHLLPNTSYHAFLVPAFETGRRAGLGMVPGDIRADTPAWGTPPAAVQLPYYHRWSFTTGSTGDFEYLVRLLKPVRADEKVGRRDMDCHRKPGFGLPGVTTPTQPDGVLRLGGALQLPDADLHIDDYENWDNWFGDTARPPYPNLWQETMAGLINLAEAYQHNTAAQANAKLAEKIPDLAGEIDPIITPPLYGRWHALTPKLLTDAEGRPVPAAELRNWVHRLNLDPRFRVAAQFGTQTVQARQEEFMAAAWAQVGDVLAANDKIRAAQLAVGVGNTLKGKHLDPAAVHTPAGHEDASPVPSGRALTLTAPAHSRVVQTPAAALASAMAAAGLSDAASPEAAALPDVVEQLVVRFQVAESKVATAPVSPEMRRVMRPGGRLVKRLKFDQDPREDLVPRLDLPAEAGGITSAPPKITPPAVVTPTKLDVFLDPKPPGDPVDTLKPNSGFTLRDLGDTETTEPDTEDSNEGARYKDSLRKLYQGWDAAAVGGTAKPRPVLGVGHATDSVLTGLRAEQTVRDAVLSSVNIPPRLKPVVGELVEVMAYPVIDLTMYLDLLKISVDTFVPNLGLVPTNSITLLESNRAFIESYLVGLNHEMARELLWREYPTDSRGTPFRQFWDPRAALSPPGESAEARRKRLYDIPPVHEWDKTSLLGRHDHRRPPPKPGETVKNNLVLVIRGELLRKYPNAAIYAHRAAWPVKDGKIDTSGERVLADFRDDLPPPSEDVRLPIYEAKVEPDIYLLGFDLEAEEARGTGVGNDLGWFFVLKERPGDPRFGLDEDPPGITTPLPVEVWNDLSWGRVDPNGHRFIQFDAGVHVELDEFNGDEDDQEKRRQREDDEWLDGWNPTISSADVAYLLFQAPVLVAVHAQDMLPPKQPIPPGEQESNA